MTVGGGGGSGGGGVGFGDGDGVGDDALDGFEDVRGEVEEQLGVLEEAVEDVGLERFGFEDGLELFEGDRLAGQLVGGWGVGGLGRFRIWSGGLAVVGFGRRW